MLLSRLFTIFHHGADAVPIFMSQLKIREMPEDERPREKLLAHGPDALSNAELIAILLRTGRRGMNVVDVARELFDKYQSFAELSRCSVKELSEIKGIGPQKHWNLWRRSIWENGSRRSGCHSENSIHQNWSTSYWVTKCVCCAPNHCASFCSTLATDCYEWNRSRWGV